MKSLIARQWCGGEMTAARQSLFEQVPDPRVVVTDGGSGIRSALANAWPHPSVQRLYGTGLDAAEGLWVRSGWAGRG
ncbi:hypothetical protein ACTJJ4_08565 [Microbacterium sp. 22195]|uniref:hypothetical protein n=1 Tax=Microbacterium sp. 22195 TaxID=3453891 RepID=UPI003F84125F